MNMLSSWQLRCPTVWTMGTADFAVPQLHAVGWHWVLTCLNTGMSECTPVGSLGHLSQSTSIFWLINMIVSDWLHRNMVTMQWPWQCSMLYVHCRARSRRSYDPHAPRRWIVPGLFPRHGGFAPPGPPGIINGMALQSFCCTWSSLGHSQSKAIGANHRLWLLGFLRSRATRYTATYLGLQALGTKRTHCTSLAITDCLPWCWKTGQSKTWVALCACKCNVTITLSHWAILVSLCANADH